MDQLCGKAYRIRGDGGKSLFVELPAALMGQDHLKAQGPEEGLPEGHILPEAQDSGKSDADVPLLQGLRDRIIRKEQLFPESKEVRNLPLLSFDLPEALSHRLVPGISQDCSLFAAVVGDAGPSVGKFHQGPLAVIAAEGTGHVGPLGIGEVLQGGKADEATFLPGPLLCQEGCADGSHKPRIGGAHHFPAHILLHGPEHRVVLKGPALDHDPLSQAVQVGEADHLGKYVFNDGTAKPRHDVLRQLSVPLFRNDAAVHEDGTAASQDCRISGGKGRLCDPLPGDPQGGGKVLQEGAAAGGAGLVHHDVGDDAVLEPDGLHVLASDVQKEGGLRQVFFRRPGMGHGLHHMAFRGKGLRKELLSVAGGAGSQDLKPGSRPFVAVPHLKEPLLCHLQGIPLIGGIKAVQDLLLFIHEHEFGGGAAGIDAKISPDLIPLLRLVGR